MFPCRQPESLELSSSPCLLPRHSNSAPSLPCYRAKFAPSPSGPQCPRRKLPEALLSPPDAAILAAEACGLQCRTRWLSGISDTAVGWNSPFPWSQLSVATTAQPAEAQPQAPLGAPEGLKLWNLHRRVEPRGCVCVCVCARRKEQLTGPRQPALLSARNGCPESEWKE